MPNPKIVHREVIIPLVVCLFFLIILAGCVAADVQAPAAGLSEWTVEGGNAERNRAVDATLAAPLRRGLDFSVGGDTTYGSPAVVAQGLIFTEGDRTLHALSLEDGSERWHFSVTGSFISPSVDDGIVFIRSERGEEGSLLALDAEEGQLVWEFRFPRVGSPYDNLGGHVTSPVAVDGRVFVGAYESLFAFDAQDGRVLWEAALGDVVVTSASVVDDLVYIGDFQQFHAIDAATGETRWQFDTDGLGIYFAPVVAGDQVIVASEDTIYSLNRGDGRLEWSKNFAGIPVIPAGASDEHVYVKSTLSLYALDILSGDEEWVYTAEDFVSLPVTVGDHLYVVARVGGEAELRAVGRSDGAEIWRLGGDPLTNAAPSFAGDYVFVRTTDGRVLGYYSEGK